MDPDRESFEERKERLHRGEVERERALSLNILAGVASVIPKLIAAFLSGSITLYASAFKTINEAIGILVAWMIARKIARGDPGTYDYGMGKFENIARIITGGVLLVSFIILVTIALYRILNPATLGTNGVAIGVATAGVMIGIDAFFWARNYRIAKKEPSPLMESQWQLFRMKTVANIVVVAALVLGVLSAGYPWAVYIDPVRVPVHHRHSFPLGIFIDRKIAPRSPRPYPRGGPPADALPGARRPLRPVRTDPCGQVAPERGKYLYRDLPRIPWG